MKTEDHSLSALIVKEDGLIYVNEVPEEPKYCTDLGDVILICGNTFCKCDSQLKGYQHNLASAKESAVLVADQDAAAGMIVLCMKFENPMKYRGSYAVGIKPGIYPIPDLQWEPRTVEKFYEGKGWFWETVAILHSPSTEKESQEEKLIKLINLYWTFDDNQRHTHSWHDKQDCIEQIRTHFTITRKQ